MHLKMIADALGGAIWVADNMMHWKPEGHECVVVVDYLHPTKKFFDADEYVRRAWAAWEKCGCRL
jgi:hypothetical protein